MGLTSRALLWDHTQLQSIGTHTHAQIDAALGYALPFSAVVTFNPADSTAYAITMLNSPVTLLGSHAVWVPTAGTIKRIYGNFVQTAGTNEPSTLELWINGAFAAIIDNALNHSGTSTIVLKTDLNIPVNAGDRLELRWTTPAWFTNPTGLRFNASVWVAT